MVATSFPACCKRVGNLLASCDSVVAEAVEPTAHPKVLRSLVPDFHVPPPPPPADDAAQRISGEQRKLRLA